MSVNVNHFLLIPWQDKHMVEWQNHLMLHAEANVGMVLDKATGELPVLQSPG